MTSYYVQKRAAGNTKYETDVSVAYHVWCVQYLSSFIYRFLLN